MAAPLLTRVKKWVFWGGLVAMLLWLVVLAGIQLRCPIWMVDSCPAGESGLWLFPFLTLPIIAIIALITWFLRDARS
jgi:hypothetical protein